MFALKLPTLQSNGIQCIGERQGPARISGSAETVADDDEDAVMMTILVMMVVTMMMVMLMLLLLILSSLPDNRLSTSSFLKKKKDFLNSLNILNDELGEINQCSMLKMVPARKKKRKSPFSILVHHGKRCRWVSQH